MIPLSLITSGIQGATGLAQFIKGKRLEKQNQRPTYEVPQEIKDKMSVAQRMAYEGLPEQAKQQYLTNLQRTSNFALGAMDDRKSGLAGLSALVQNENDATNNLMVQDAQAQQSNLANLMNMQSEMAGYKDKAFELNKYNPYLEKANAAQSMKGAGLQNMAGSLDNLVGIGDKMSILNQFEDDDSAVSEFQKQMQRRKAKKMGLNFDVTDITAEDFTPNV